MTREPDTSGAGSPGPDTSRPDGSTPGGPGPGDSPLPPPLEYTSQDGLVVVDMQNDFADPDGGLYVPGGEETLEAVNGEIAATLQAGGTVIYTQDWHPESTPHFVKDGGTWPVHCVAGTWGARLHPELVVAGPVVRKGVDGGDGYSGFSVRDPRSGDTTATELGELLAQANVSRLTVVGLAGDVCVKETALDGRRLGFPVRVPWHATRAVNLSDGDDSAAQQALGNAGVVLC